jgi:chlorobactene glucosyltransferase
MALFLATVPWLLLVAALPVLLRQRPSLSAYPPTLPLAPPLVSVIVPTLDDARRVGASLARLLDTDYPAFEVVVADVDSGDGTREIVEALEARASDRVRLVDAGVPPVGRGWRAWACRQGFAAANGELILFTQPGTLHESGLLPRAVSVLEQEGADLVSVYPRLTMQGFWERLVMPHIWLVLTARLPTAKSVNRWQDPADALATHHFMLIRREAYEAIGGHDPVAERDPEAPTLARAVLRTGRRVFLVHGEEFLETRMYRTLAGIADELSVTASAASRWGMPAWARTVAAAAVAATPVLFFVVPPVALAASLLGLLGPSTTTWASGTTALSLLFWLVVYARHRIRPAYAVAYPAGALVSSLAFARTLLLQNDP